MAAENPLLKIAFLSLSNSWGGLEMNLVRYAGWMKDRGHEVHVLCNSASQVHTVAQSLGLDCCALPKEKGRLWKSHTLDYLNKHRIEVLWFREKDIQKRLPGINRKYKGLISLYQQGMQLGSGKKDPYHLWLYSFIDLWISPNSFMYDQILNKTYFPEKRLHQIPLAINQSSFLEKRMSKSAARKLLELSENKFLVGVIGRIDPQKNQLTVLKAFKDIAEELNIDLLFLGDVTHGEGDQYLQELKSFVSVNQLEDRVSFRAYRQDVECFYSAVDLMIVPSLFESFGRVTLEGMCYGIPVVGANTGGTAELIGKENDDFLFDPLDHMACSRIIHRLFSDNELRLQFGKKLLKRVDDRFSHNAVLKQLEELLHSSIT